jgi:holo-[acyl-carrier protein] synthase
MIYGIGTDLLDAGRIRDALERWGDRLPQRILHPEEWVGYRTARDPASHLARCYAIKEAASKALGLGFRGIAYNDIGSIRNSIGKPELVFSKHAHSVMNRMGVGPGFVSVSDEGEMIVAMVVFERA